ncbi:hypothetical protein OOJ91_12515 [Micromonospora lupini]|uniref:hypothetical protein n=1 Tax=Micromonospora lupini TaxID=285679 RepID=UPI002257E549|nr:hypothetical protein [Micromonospora lupini]MCX5066703.1 hypothetical protein [Micromonospora lupini]
MGEALVTDIRDGLMVNLLRDLGASHHAARQIAGNLVRDYLADQPATPDRLADLTANQRGAAFELALMLCDVARHAGHASCPDLGPAADHAAAATRHAINPANC